MKIAVVGTGYVGLVTGTCLSETGNQVVCVDIDSEKVKRMEAGQVPIYEPGLESLLKRNIEKGRLSFTTKLKEGIKGAKVIFLALPTPPNEDGTADLRYVLGVADDLGPLLEDYVVIVDKSTVPVGTAELVGKRIKKSAKTDFDVVSNPEFLREGLAVADFMNPDRIVIGTSSEKARKIMGELYDSFTRSGSPIFYMDERSAEVTKYAANSFLATKISFMNEIANICERVDADVDSVRMGIGADPRIGNRFLFPGIGFGGSCFPKDVMALHRISMENDYDFKILEAVMMVNAWQKELIVNKIVNFFDGDISDKKIALWGLAFKPDTDDIREAPALEIIKNLTAIGASLVAYDPEAMPNVKKYFEKRNLKIEFAEDQFSALEGADALVIVTEWPAFLTPDFTKMKKLLKEPVIFDGRNIYELDAIRRHGFHYESIGRRVVD